MSAFYDQASLVVVPSGYKAGKVYAQKPLTTDGQLSFTRSTGATRVGPSGLIEKVRTNLLVQSNQFDTTWVKNGLPVLTSGQSGYDGTSDAWLLSNSGFQYDSIRQTVSVSGVTTFSVYAKANTLDYLALAVQPSSGTGAFQWFNLSTGSLGSDLYGNVISAKMDSLGSGWYRCTMAVNTTTPNLRIYPVSADADFTTTAGNIYIQDAQLEVGDIATDYIETTSAAVSVGPVANVPRLDYLGSSCPRLLLEPQRTNLVTYSEQMDNTASWTRSRCSAFGSGSVVNAIASPDGYTNAEYIQQESGQTIGGGVYTGTSYTSGTTYTLSVFAKQGENRYLRIGYSIGSGGLGIFCNFDLQDGIAGTPDTGITAKIENYGNGWYRCAITATSQITGVALNFVYQSSNFNSTTTTPLQGIYVWGAQLEAGAYATSYIPTLGAAVTRGVDQALKSSISSLIGQSAGTLYGEFTFDSSEPVNRVFSITGANWNTDGSIRFDINNNKPEIFARKAGAEIGSQLAINYTISKGQTIKWALVYTASTMKLFVDGAQRGTITSLSTTPPACSQLFVNELGAGFSSATQNNQRTLWSQVLLFTSALSDADAAALTA